MVLYLVLTLVAALLDVSSVDPHFRDPASEDLSQEAQLKLDDLNAQVIGCTSPTMLYNGTGCGVIEIQTGEQYVNYVITAPRPYDLFVLFVVTRGHCCAGRVGGSCRKLVCSNAEDAFYSAATSYYAKGQRPKEDGDPTFFAIVRCDMDDLRPICNEMHKLDVVPKLVHARSKSFTRRQGVLRFRVANTFSESKSSWPKEEVLEWINGITGRGVREQIDMFKMMSKMLPLFAILIAGLAVVYVGTQLVRELPWLMVVVAIGVQWLGCSGLTYCIIQGSWSHPKDQFFSGSMRHQFFEEGLLCSGMMCGAGLCVALAAYLNSIEDDGRNRKMTIGRQTAALVAIIAALGCGQSVMAIYSSFKSRWYRTPPFYPPDDYEIGPLMADRQLSFINYRPVPWFQSHPIISAGAALVLSSRNVFFNFFGKFMDTMKMFGRDLHDSPLRIIRITYVKIFDTIFDVVEVVLSPFVAIGGKKKKSKTR